MAWDPDYIDFISEYCDRWCERCPLTHKCAAYTRETDPRNIDECANRVEQAMDSLRLELAMPAPPSPPWANGSCDRSTSPEDQTTEEHRALWKRPPVPGNPMLETAHDYAVDVYTWLRLYEQPTRRRAQEASAGAGDSVEAAVLRLEIETVFEALQIVQWDSTLIPAKLHRALMGRAERLASLEDDPVQTDFNGSAKLALILTERSEAGWRLIAQWAPHPEIAIQLANTLAPLRADIDRAFPEARRFMRPGFDETPC
jgi:hypothetical protein